MLGKLYQVVSSPGVVAKGGISEELFDQECYIKRCNFQLLRSMKTVVTFICIEACDLLKKFGTGLCCGKRIQNVNIKGKLNKE